MDLNESWIRLKVDLMNVCMQKLIAIPQTDPEHKQIKDGHTTENGAPDPSQIDPSGALLLEWKRVQLAVNRQPGYRQGAS